MTGPISISLVTGFLGSGKTTLIRRLLLDPLLQGTAVIVNDLAPIGLDDLLLQEGSAVPRERAGDRRVSAMDLRRGDDGATSVAREGGETARRGRIRPDAEAGKRAGAGPRPDAPIGNQPAA